MSDYLTPNASIERNCPGKSAVVKKRPRTNLPMLFCLRVFQCRYMRLKLSCAGAWGPRPRHLFKMGRLVDVMHMQYGQRWENRVFPRKVFH